MYGSQTITETKYRGSKTITMVTHKESVMVADEQQLLAEILKHLEFCKHPGRLDPGFEMDTDRETGRVKRVVKVWSEAA